MKCKNIIFLFLFILLFFNSSFISANSRENRKIDLELHIKLPKKYDLRNLNGNSYITSVKNQYKDGGCRSFASLASLESHIFLKTGNELDLSENNMEVRHGYYYNSIPSPENARKGRTRESDIGYLISDKGPYLEKDDIYRPFLQKDLFVPNGIDKFEYYKNLVGSEDEAIGIVGGKFIPYRVVGLDFLKSIDITKLKLKNNSELYEIKKSIIENGAIVTDIYISHDGNSTFPYTNDKYYNTETFAYYSDGRDGKYFEKYNGIPNHAVSIIGWDDDFSKDNFITKPPIDGAWIVKDSQGTTFGENGFYYVSYASVSMGKNPYVFTKVVSGDTYKKIYQYDEIPFSGYIQSDKFAPNFGEKTILFNRYKAEDKEILTDIGFFTTKPGAEYEIYLIPNFKLFETEIIDFFEDDYDEYYKNIQKYKVFSGIKENAGYHVLKLSKELDLTLNKDFAIGIWTKNPNINDSKYDMVIETSKNTIDGINYGNKSYQFENQTYTFSFDGFIDLNKKPYSEKINASVKGYVKNK